MKKILTNLTTWVLLAIISGAILGHYDPQKGIQMEVLGKSFIQVVKLFIFPLIFLTITLGISGMNNLKSVGRVGAKALLYFEVVTTFALLIGIIVGYWVRPGEGVKAAIDQVDLSKFQQGAAHFSWFSFLSQNITLQVLILSIFIGIWLSKYSRKEFIINYLNQISKYVFKALHLVMLFAPIGAFGGMAFTIGKYGIAAIQPLAKLMVTMYTTMGIFIFVILWLILRYYRVSLLGLLNYIKEELLVVLGTSSSEAALPPLMEKLEKMGCPKSVVGLVIPAGYSFNLDGTTIYLSMAVIFLAQVYGIQFSMHQLFTIIGILMITSKGAAGVTGSGFIVLVATITAVPVVPVEGLALLIGVDRFMSEARAITNIIGNAVATIFIANSEGDFNREQMANAFNTEEYEYRMKI